MLTRFTKAIRSRHWLAAMAMALLNSAANGHVKLPNIFSDHMVLQQGQQNKIWGSAHANQAITVSIDKQRHSVMADSNGKWVLMLDPLPVGGPYQLTVQGKDDDKVQIEDVLVGEVWICSGQSNMQWTV